MNGAQRRCAEVEEMTLRRPLSMFVARGATSCPVANQQEGEPTRYFANIRFSGDASPYENDTVAVASLAYCFLFLLHAVLVNLLIASRSSPLFPDLPRPVYQQESFAALALAHFLVVGISSLFAVVVGRRGDSRSREESGKSFVTVGRLSPPSGRPFRRSRWRSRYPSWVWSATGHYHALICMGCCPSCRRPWPKAGRGILPA